MELVERRSNGTAKPLSLRFPQIQLGDQPPHSPPAFSCVGHLSRGPHRGVEILGMGYATPAVVDLKTAEDPSRSRRCSPAFFFRNWQGHVNESQRGCRKLCHALCVKQASCFGTETWAARSDLGRVVQQLVTWACMFLGGVITK